MKEYEKLIKASFFLKAKGFAEAEFALVLGSGLGGLANEVENPISMNTEEIPGYPVSSVEGHKGRIILGELFGVRMLIFQGRIHYYEGYSAIMSCAPTIVSNLLGIRSIILTNAAGAINPAFTPGELMLIEDCLNFAFIDPFADLRKTPHCHCERSEAISLTNNNINKLLHLDRSGLAITFNQIALKAAEKEKIVLHRGTLAMMAGPSYETPAEVKILRLAGADAVSMSTVNEIILAHQLGMKVLGISLITNMASGMGKHRLSHKEVQRMAGKYMDKIKQLLKNIIKLINYQL
jgi:purine-nucleoside phosphorylase